MSATLSIERQILDSTGKISGTDPKLSAEFHRELLFHMLRVRGVDERMLKLQRAGRIGFVGSMYGLEAAMIGSAAALEPQDWLWSGLREGGAALMRGLPLYEYIAQMYGNGSDTAKGRQMCNHHQHVESHYPSWSSVIGTQIPHGVGAAYASKLRGENAVHAVYFGDGATSSNGFHSGLNFAAVWKAPVVFMCVDNGWAISVPSKNQTAGEYVARGDAYGMEAHEVDGNDVLATFEASRVLVERARTENKPALLVIKTYRMSGHSSSDDPTVYRDQAEVDHWAKLDPLDRFETYLTSIGQLKPDGLKELYTEVIAEIDAESNRQEAAPKMALRSLVDDVYANVPNHLQRQYNRFLEVSARHGDATPGDGAFPL
ncbi:MAG: pyruvate dehydrogenase E1 component alpha subunit [Planctomycetota bacterium]|jgi:pyruvate dehydrogenase E1 component alpha subunit